MEHITCPTGQFLAVSSSGSYSICCTARLRCYRTLTGNFPVSQSSTNGQWSSNAEPASRSRWSGQDEVMSAVCSSQIVGMRWGCSRAVERHLQPNSTSQLPNPMLPCPIHHVLQKVDGTLAGKGRYILFRVGWGQADSQQPTSADKISPPI